jgi:hypothetical protein
VGSTDDRNADETFRQTFSGTHRAASGDQNRVEVACPHPDCGRTATAPLPDAGTEITVTRSVALFGDHERVRCPSGHKVFVHYCTTS